MESQPKLNKHYCHSCGEEADRICQTCEQDVCGDCTMEFTYMSQIDYDLCLDCNNDSEIMWAQEREEEERYGKLIDELGYGGVKVLEEIERQLKKFPFY